MLLSEENGNSRKEKILLRLTFNYCQYANAILSLRDIWKKFRSIIEFILMTKWKSYQKSLIILQNGVMVSVLTSCVIDRRFKLCSSQTKDYNIGICCFSTKHTVLRSKSNKWSDIPTCVLLFQWAVNLKIQLSVLVYYKVDIISWKCKLFSPWSCWIIAYVALNNNHSVAQAVTLVTLILCKSSKNRHTNFLSFTHYYCFLLWYSCHCIKICCIFFFSPQFLPHFSVWDDFCLNICICIKKPW
jgi:hypothetical protein